jgi:hypothetical protein
MLSPRIGGLGPPGVASHGGVALGAFVLVGAVVAMVAWFVTRVGPHVIWLVPEASRIEGLRRASSLIGSFLDMALLSRLRVLKIL